MSGLLFLFLTKRKSGWGICGSSWCLVWFLVCCDLPALLDLLGPCTNVVLTAYAHVRTEPQCDIGHTRGKKKLRRFSGRRIGSVGASSFEMILLLVGQAGCISVAA